MTSKECYVVLGLPSGADLAEVKRAYRRLAFSLHPDLNPDVPDASRRFQRLNEAYVTLSDMLQPKATSAKTENGRSDEAGQKARDEARRAYSRAKAQEDKKQRQQAREQTKSRPREEVVNDILNDPFARRVFEDIYSHIKHKKEEGREPPLSPPPPRQPGKAAGRPFRPSLPSTAKKLVNKVTGWLRRQIDDEQTIYLPASSLVPGAKVRLDIHHGLTGKSQAVEITLPPGFEPGKPIRLKGMGKKVGSWKGDLYVRIVPDK